MSNYVDKIISEVANVERGNEEWYRYQEISMQHQIVATQQQMINVFMMNIIQQSAKKPRKNYKNFDWDGEKGINTKKSFHTILSALDSWFKHGTYTLQIWLTQLYESKTWITKKIFLRQSFAYLSFIGNHLIKSCDDKIMKMKMNSIFPSTESIAQLTLYFSKKIWFLETPPQSAT